jgi:hypothetical protein
MIRQTRKNSNNNETTTIRALISLTNPSTTIAQFVKR